MRENKPSRRFLFALALLLLALFLPGALTAQSAEGSADSSSDSLVWLTEEEWQELQTLLTTSETELSEQEAKLTQLTQELTALRTELSGLRELSMAQQEIIETLGSLLAELRTSLGVPAIGLGLTADYGASGPRVGVSVEVTF